MKVRNATSPSSRATLVFLALLVTTSRYDHSFDWAFTYTIVIMGIKRRLRILCFVSTTADPGVELAHVIQEEAPDAIKTGEIKNHFGRKVAIVSLDCQLFIYIY